MTPMNDHSCVPHFIEQLPPTRADWCLKPCVAHSKGSCTPISANCRFRSSLSDLSWLTRSLAACVRSFSCCDRSFSCCACVCECFQECVCAHVRARASHTCVCVCVCVCVCARVMGLHVWVRLCTVCMCLEQEHSDTPSRDTARVVHVSVPLRLLRVNSSTQHAQVHAARVLTWTAPTPTSTDQ